MHGARRYPPAVGVEPSDAVCAALGNAVTAVVLPSAEVVPGGFAFDDEPRDVGAAIEQFRRALAASGATAFVTELTVEPALAGVAPFACAAWIVGP
jgi:hypothetical protein